MEAIDVFFSGTPQQFAAAVNSLVGSRLLPKTGKIVFNVSRKDSDSVLIRVQTPDPIDTPTASPCAVPTSPRSKCTPSRPAPALRCERPASRQNIGKLPCTGGKCCCPAYVSRAGRSGQPASLRRPNATKTRRRSVGRGLPTETLGHPLREVMEDELRKYLRWRLREHKSQEDAANLVVGRGAP